MAFEASDYAIWMVFTFLEALAIRFSRNRPDLQPIRAFMALCLMRDFILLAWSCHPKYFWASYWISQSLELIGLALIAGYMIGKTRPWRISAFTIAVMCVHYGFKGWPITCLPAEIFHFERNCCIVIFSTLLVGGVFIWSKNQLPLAGSVGILALSDMFSAQSFLMGDYSPRMASVLWVLGLLSILVTASRVAPEPRRNKSGETQALAASRTDMHSPRELARLLVATPTFDASQTQEWLLLPCRTQVQ